MIIPRYVPGEWFALVTDGTVVLLPPSTSAEVVEEMWGSVREHTELAEHLGVLARERITSLPPFALVSVAAGRVHVIVRGDVEVEVAGERGSRVLTAPEVSTWSEAVVAGAHAVQVRAGSSSGWDGSAGLAVLSAVVRADQVQVSLRAEAVEAGADEVATSDEAAARVPAVVPDPEAALLTGALPVADEVRAARARDDHARAVREPDPQVPVERRRTSERRAHPEPALEATGDMTLVREPRREVPTAPPAAAPSPAPAAGPAPAWSPILAPETAGDPVPTAAETRARHAHQEPSPVDLPVMDDEADDHDGLTVLSSDVVALRRQLPEWAGDAVPGPIAVPAAATPAPAKILLSSGLVVALNRPVLLGRAPQVSRVTNSQLPRLVTVASPNQDISRTHAEVRQEGDDVVVTDLRSTNGVLLLRQGTGPQRLHPGEPTVVEPGVVVDLGEGVTFVVERGT